MKLSEAIDKDVKDNPDIPSRTLARIIYAKNPDGFLNIESVRCSVRYLRGLTDKCKKGVNYGKYASDRGEYASDRGE